MKTIFAFFLVISCSLFAQNQESPPKILVIGAGPAGLATAIEAKQNGADVTIVEKRDEYTRRQWVFLVDTSLALLDKWQVVIPEMQITEWVNEVRETERLGVIQINLLEECLEKRSIELGIKKIQGEFQGIKHRSAVVVSQNKRTLIPYDLLVGADGTHSRVREALGIENVHLGTAKGISALIPCSETKPLEISEAISVGGFFIRRISTPATSVIFTQSKDFLTEKQFQEAVNECGWLQESSLLAEEKALLIKDIEINLQQAKSFSSEEHSTILVGDAAATASFFQGLGANTALKTAELAGVFFKKKLNKDSSAFPEFNQAMLKTTNVMIDDSRFLFSESKPE